MNRWLDQWKRKMQQFMIGRYGADPLSRFISFCMIALLAVNLFVRNGILYWIAVLLLGICYYRMFSKNIGARFRENERYLNLRFRVSEGWKRRKYYIGQLKEYHIYKCPGCGQKIRIPRGRGRVSIHCPKCNTDFIKRS